MSFSTDNVAREVEPQAMGSTTNFDLLKTNNWSNLPLHSLLSQPVILHQVSQFEGTPVSLDWFSHSALLDVSQFHLDKVRGYMGLRATCVIRMVVNADKYTAGRICLSYQPTSTVNVFDRGDFRHFSQLQNVELDLNTDTEVTLRIPHRGPYTHFDITNRRLNTGIFRVRESLPHRGDPYTVTVYQSFEDIDLLGPTAPTTVTYQGGLMTIEEENIPLSKKVANIASAMYAFATVPLLTPIVEPMAWATSVGSGVLAAFGYSKPLQTKTPEVFLERAGAKLNHCDGADYAEQLAMTTTTGVRLTDQIGLTKEDEMSFAYLLGIKSYLYRFSYDITTPSGTKLLTFPLAPWLMQASSNVQTAAILHPMAYLANVFSVYRGSIEMTIHLSKTIFHSGRLMVVFEPIIPFGATAPASRVATLADAINCHRDVVDIRKGSTFSFKFPFVSTTPYLDVERPYGYVHIFVVNQLVRNDLGVTDTIDLGLKFNACSDMEFAGPTDPRYFPYENGPGETTVDLGITDPITLANVDYQSGLEVGDSVIVSKNIGSTSEPQACVDMAELCIGEKILSVKQLAMRGKVVWGGTGAVGTSSAIGPCQPLAIDPFVSANFGFGRAGEAASHDFYSYVGCMYNYARGGAILMVHNVAENNCLAVGIKVDPYRRSTSAELEPYSEWYLKGFVKPSTTERLYIAPYDNSYVRFTVPVLPSSTLAGRYTEQFEPGYSHLRLIIQDADSGLSTNAYRLYRSAAEDTQFGGFAGVPLCILREPYASVWNTTSVDKDKRELPGSFFPNS